MKYYLVAVESLELCSNYVPDLVPENLALFSPSYALFTR